MFNLGLMYEKHRGVSSDASEVDLMEATRECYQAAAESGITKAMVNLGVLCMSGRLPGREPGGALEWFKKAADGGDVSGKFATDFSTSYFTFLFGAGHFAMGPL